MCKAKLFIHFLKKTAGYISLQLFALYLNALSCGSDSKIRISKLLQHLHLCKALDMEKTKVSFFPRIRQGIPQALDIALSAGLGVFLLSLFSPDVLTQSFTLLVCPPNSTIFSRWGQFPPIPPLQNSSQESHSFAQSLSDAIACCFSEHQLLLILNLVILSPQLMPTLSLNKTLSKQLTFLTVRNSFEHQSDIIFQPSLSWYFPFLFALVLCLQEGIRHQLKKVPRRASNLLLTSIFSSLLLST